MEMVKTHQKWLLTVSVCFCFLCCTVPAMIHNLSTSSEEFLKQAKLWCDEANSEPCLEGRAQFRLKKEMGNPPKGSNKGASTVVSVELVVFTKSDVHLLPSAPPFGEHSEFNN
eukprot:TRINITY_DN37914_c0_g1_i1.p1 TRINITY_DN37914_c0_g1~~TRINITY_DN37914_c0_g1_i1.p1  ORF type:complete len:113 (+),score=20.12 TRINITY_DN37914_c0_g1_i1:201-539(+)